MFERSIGIRLTLLPAFAEATKLIVSDIGKINKGLQSINEQGSKINVDGLKLLNQELSNLVGAADAANKAISALNGIKITKNVFSALEIGMTGVATSAKVAKEKIKEVEVQVEQTAAVVETETVVMSKGFFNLAQEIALAEKAMAKLGLFALPGMNNPVVGMRNLTSEIMLAEQAMRRLDTFVPKQLNNSIFALNSGLREMRALTTGAGPTPMALGPGPSWSTGNATYGTRNMSLGAGAAPESTPWTSVTGDRPNMLGAGNWTGNNITPYGERNVTPGSTAYNGGTGGSFYEGSGAISPYTQDLGRGQWQGRNIPGQTNYGPVIPSDFGPNITKFGSSMMRSGDQIQSFGWSSLMPAMMTAGIAGPAIKQQMDVQDLYAVAHEALQAVGAKPESYAANMAGAEQASTQYGGSLRENISGMYTFASSIPAVSKVDWNDPKQQELMKQAYMKITEGGIVGGRSTHPVSQEHSILDILASVVNLGLPMSNAKELANSIKLTTDMFTQVKNSTSTDFDLLGSTLRNVGAVAHNMGISWQDTMEMTKILAEGKYRGSIAGTSMKRIFSRQTMQPKQEKAMVDLVASFGGNVSMYDKGGKTLSPLDFLANVAKFEDQHHLSSQAKSKLEGSLSGLYAGAPMGEMVNMARAMGGSAGLKKDEAEMVKQATAGTGATDAAYDTRNMHGKNIKLESQKVDNTWQLEMTKTFEMMSPDIINVLHSIQGLIQVWHGLSPAVQTGIVRVAAFGTILLGVGGIAAIFIGNFTKIGGAFTFLTGKTITMSGLLNSAKGIISGLGSAVGGILGPAFNIAKMAIGDFLIAIGPVGWIIGGVVIAVGVLALAWSKDWGGIREKTASAISFIGDEIKKATDFLKGLATSGATYAKMFGDGVANGIKGAADKVKQGLQGIADLFPHSEPKDGSSPLHGQTASGTAYSDMFINAAIIGLTGGKTKIKKAAKPVGDVFMELKSESVGYVIEMANKIESELARAGAVIKNRWIDLYNPKTGQITRTHGDVAAFKVAIGTNVHDTSVQQARDYLQKIEREIKSGAGVNIDKAIATLTNLSIHALSDHAMAQINEMIFVLRGASHKAGDAIAKEFEKTKSSVESHLSTVGRSGDKFDLIQQQMGEKVPTLGTDPTTKDLTSVIKSETAERNALGSALLNEQEDAKSLASEYNKLNSELSKLNGSSAYEKKIRADKKAELDAIAASYAAVNSRITEQKSVVDGLTNSIKQQTDALKHAKDSWSGLFYNVQQQSVSSAIDKNFKDIADHVQNYFQRQNLPTGSAGSDPARQSANNYANQAFQQLFQGMFGTSSSTGLEKLFHAGHKGDKKTGVPPTQAETEYIQRADKGNEHLSNIEKNTQYLNPSKVGIKSTTGGSVNTNSGQPMPVSLWDQTGSTDVGAASLDAQNAIMNNTASVSFNGGSTGSNKAGDQSQNQTSLQKFQGVADQASQAYNLYNGLKAGGVGGAVEAGSSAYSMTGNPYIAAAAAIIGFIGIGPHRTAEQTPDISNPQYGQNLANWAGTQQLVNGQQIQPGQQYSKYLGAQNQAQQMYSFVSNPSSQIGMNPAQQTAIKQMAALAGNMGAAGLAIKSEHQGELTLASGQKISVNNFDDLLTTTNGMLSQFQNNAIQQQQNADRLASSFTAMVLNGPAGFTMPDFVGGGSGQRGVVHRMPSDTTGNQHMRTTQSTSATQTITIQVMPNATVHGASVEVVQTAIENAIPQITQAVNAHNYGAARFSGNYVSSNW